MDNPKRTPKRPSTSVGGTDGGLKIISPICGAMQELKVTSPKKKSSKLKENRKNPNAVVPVDLSTQFVAAVMSKDFHAAKDLCTQILKIDPKHETAREFLPVINERIAIDLENNNDDDDDDDGGNESTDNDEEDADDDNNDVENKLEVSEQYQASGVLLRDFDSNETQALRQSLAASTQNKDRHQDSSTSHWR